MDSKNNLENIQAIFLEALNFPTSQRQQFVEQHPNNDKELKREVLELLLHHQEKNSVLDKPVFEEGINLLQQQTNIKTEYIGYYKLVKELGRGGMATVYLAERNDAHYQQKVAIKLIQPALITETLTKMFVSERQIMANLSHNNIAKLLDGGMTDYGSPYLVMEYIDGLPIDQYCNACKMPIIERIRLFSKVCEAVQYAHQNLVVHRDIKPNNILVISNGTPKLLDFGVAKLINHTNFLSTYTQPQNRFLTPIYASPEQISGQPITTTSDVYSLGVLLYELITGHLPYKCSQISPDEIKRIICEEEPIKPSQVVLDTQENFFVNSTLETPKKLSKIIKGDLETIILTALRKEPYRRYSSVERLVEDLDLYLTGLPIKTRKETLTYWLAKFVKRNKIQVAAASLLTLSLLGGIVATSWQAHRANIAQATAEKRFNDVRKLANSFLFEFNTAIETLPGATPAREMVVQKALEYLDSLNQEAGNDLELQYELGKAYQKVGDIQGNPNLDNLGHPDQALQSYYKAVKIHETIVSKQPNSQKDLYALALLYSRIGGTLLITGKVTEGLEYKIKAVPLQEKVIQNGYKEAYKEMIPNYVGLAEAFRLNGKNDEALKVYQKAIDCGEKLLTNNPNELFFKKDLAAMYRLAGAHILEATGDSEKGLKYCTLSLKLFQELLNQEPDNAQMQHGLATIHDTLAIYFSNHGNPTQALIHQSQNLKIRQVLVEKDPRNIKMQYNLYVGYFNNAEIYNITNNPSKALEAFLQALTTIEKIIQINPTNRFRESLAYNYIVVGEIETGLSKKNNAESHLQKAIDILEDLHKQNPINPAIISELARALKSQASLLSKANPIKAKEFVARSLSMQKELADRPSALVAELVDYAKTLLYAEQIDIKNPTQALNYIQKAAKMSQNKDPEVLRVLAFNYYLLAQKKEAIQTTQEALALVPKNSTDKISSLRNQLETDLKKYSLTIKSK